jgi:hypothetical protein
VRARPADHRHKVQVAGRFEAANDGGAVNIDSADVSTECSLDDVDDRYGLVDLGSF